MDTFLTYAAVRKIELDTVMREHRKPYQVYLLRVDERLQSSPMSVRPSKQGS